MEKGRKKSGREGKEREGKRGRTGQLETLHNARQIETGEGTYRSLPTKGKGKKRSF